MDFSELFICRGCASVVAGDPVSLMDPGVKDLYQKCTYQLLPDLTSDSGPYQICQECYDKCQNWFLFKSICNENEQLYSPDEMVSKKHGLLPATDYIDGGLEESMILQVEEDEEDLLEVLLQISKAADIKPDELNPVSSSTPRQEEPDCLEIRLSMLMGIPWDENINSSPETQYLKEQLNQSPDNIGCSPNSTQSNIDKGLVIPSTKAPNMLLNLEQEMDYIAVFSNPPDEEEYEVKHQDVTQSMKRFAKNYVREESISQKKKNIIKPFRTEAADMWKCPLCDIIECTRWKLEEHLIREHSEPQQGLLRCPICPPCFEIADPTLVPHLLNWHIGNFNCRLCFAIFNSKARFQNHLLHQHVFDEASKFNGCPLCSASCKFGGLEDHLRKEHLESQKSLNCPACPAHYTSTVDVIEHIVSYHAAHWKCTKCVTRSYSAETFAVHESQCVKEQTMVHYEPKKARYQCGSCDMIFLSGVKLQDHTRISHPV